MKKIDISIVSIVTGILLLAVLFKFDIQDGIGFTLCMIGLVTLLGGIIANKKVREVVLNLIFNFM